MGCGPVNFETGVVNGAVNLHWTGNVNVREIFQKYVDCPVYVDNDANVAALGESIKVLAKVQMMLLLLH